MQRIGTQRKDVSGRPYSAQQFMRQNALLTGFMDEPQRTAATHRECSTSSVWMLRRHG